MKILSFVGDIHGSFEPTSKFSTKIRQKENVIYFQCGDFGIGFGEIDKDIKKLNILDELLQQRNSELYVIRGNHDDPKYFNGSFNQFTNIKFLPDYSILEIQGHKILCVGGAISVDRVFRKEGLSYWKNEPFVLKDDYKELPTDCDIIVTHSAPVDFFPYGLKAIDAFLREDPPLREDLIDERKKLHYLYEHLKPGIKHWFYGHFHQTKNDFYGTFTAHLLNINEFYFLNEVSS